MRKEIEAKLGHLQKYRGYLARHQGATLSQLQDDYMLRAAVERYLQLCLEIVLEIGQMVIGAEGLRKPEKNREVIEILGEAGVLPASFAQRFAPAGGFRNILVHGYEKVDIKEVYANLKRAEDFDIFARHISAYLKKQKG